MIKAIRAAATNGNKLTRCIGGYWVWTDPYKFKPSFDPEKNWFDTNTVQGLVTRGLATYTQWARSGFATEATITPAGLAIIPKDSK